MYMYDHSSFAFKSVFLEFFQKPLGRWWTTAKPLICFVWFSRFLRGTAWR